MCGIVGYVGPRQAQAVVVEGLRRLEYRGYDSAGIALVDDGRVASAKKAGKLANLEKELADHPLPESTTGIGHTRWATHGPPTNANAHPHLGATGRVALVHNGIIENFTALRTELEDAGHELLSDTDTEVAARLLELELLAGGDLTTAMQATCRRSRARSRSSPSTGSTRRGWWPRGATARWWWGSARARTSSARTSRRSSSTPVRRWSSGRTRS